MDITALIEAMKDPQMRHAAVVHMPIALALLALIPVAVSAVAGGRNKTLRWTVLIAYALLLLSAIIGVRSGEDAEEETGPLPDAVHETLEEHEHMAEKVWMFALASALLAGIAFAPGKKVRVTSSWAVLLSGLATAGWLGVTAHHGGTLVYASGVGTPGGVPQTDDPSGDASGLIADGADPRLVFFRDEVRPLLEARCMTCHHGDKPRSPGGLDQSTIAGILTGGHSGPSVIPGNPDESLLVRVAKWEIEDLRMPPPRSGGQLTPEEIAVLERWVREGAVWAE